MAKNLFALICREGDSQLAQKAGQAYESAYECRPGVLLIATDAIAASVIKRLNIGGEDDTLGVLLPLKGQPGGYWEPAVWEWFETQRES